MAEVPCQEDTRLSRSVPDVCLKVQRLFHQRLTVQRLRSAA